MPSPSLKARQVRSLESALCFVLFSLQIKRLKLRKNNWNSESYRFDEVFTDTASQKRVYEGVAKPVVEVRSFSHVESLRIFIIDIHFCIGSAGCSEWIQWHNYGLWSNWNG